MSASPFNDVSSPVSDRRASVLGSISLTQSVSLMHNAEATEEDGVIYLSTQNRLIVSASADFLTKGKSLKLTHVH